MIHFRKFEKAFCLLSFFEAVKRTGFDTEFGKNAKWYHKFCFLFLKIQEMVSKNSCPGRTAEPKGPF